MKLNTRSGPAQPCPWTHCCRAGLDPWQPEGGGPAPSAALSKT